MLHCLPEALVTRHIQQFKTGVRGVGYVKLREDAVWPDRLQKNLVGPSEPAPPPPEVSSTGSGSAE